MSLTNAVTRAKGGHGGVRLLPGRGKWKPFKSTLSSSKVVSAPLLRVLEESKPWKRAWKDNLNGFLIPDANERCIPQPNSFLEREGFHSEPNTGHCCFHPRSSCGVVPPGAFASRNFRISNLGRLLKNEVLAYRRGKDAYTKEPIISLFGYEMDHILELHMICYCLDQVAAYQCAAAARNLNEQLLEVVNSPQNLNFTSRPINIAKYNANSNFQKDYLAGKLKGEVKHYFRNASATTFPLSPVAAGMSKKQISRISSRIRKEQARSFSFIVKRLDCTNPMNREFIDVLGNLLAAARVV